MVITVDGFTIRSEKVQNARHHSMPQVTCEKVPVARGSTEARHLAKEFGLSDEASALVQRLVEILEEQDF